MLSVSSFVLFLLFRLCLMFCFQIMKKHCFPCNSSFFGVLLAQRLSFFWLKCLFLFFVLYASFSKMKLECFMCVLSFLFIRKHKTRLFVWILLSASFEVLYFSYFSILAKTENRHGKNTKPKMQKKNNPFFQLAQLCAQIMFLIFGVGLKHGNLCWKHYKNGGVGKIKTTKKAKHCPKLKVNIWSKHRSISGPSMLRNISGPDVDLWKWSILGICFVRKISFYLQEECLKKTEKTKQKKQNLDQILTYQKANLGPDIDSTDIYIHTYICCKAEIGTPFNCQTCRFFKKAGGKWVCQRYLFRVFFQKLKWMAFLPFFCRRNLD